MIVNDPIADMLTRIRNAQTDPYSAVSSATRKSPGTMRL